MQWYLQSRKVRTYIQCLCVFASTIFFFVFFSFFPFFTAWTFVHWHIEHHETRAERSFLCLFRIANTRCDTAPSYGKTANQRREFAHSQSHKKTKSLLLLAHTFFFVFFSQRWHLHAHMAVGVPVHCSAPYFFACKCVRTICSLYSWLHSIKRSVCVCIPSKAETDTLHELVCVCTCVRACWWKREWARKDLFILAF